MMATASGTEEEKKLSATAERFSRRFSLAEIQLATEDFSEAHLIGKGGFGKVYKGLVDNGQLNVAIKQLASNSNQGADEFLMEIETLSKVRHVNLVSLIGYCSENGEMILVYEYIAYGTLADHLYRSSGDDVCLSLTWKQRLQTCIGAARGLEYLHTGSSIIHRDVKSTNILLDENFTAKVSDFGLAKHLSASNSKSHVSTIVKGSFGYLDPSYFTTGRLTRKSDTYAFGVVLLEVLCGRAAVDTRVSEDAWSLVIWAREKIRKGKVDQIIVSNLREEISADCLKTFVGVVKGCLHLEPKKRRTMSQVVVQLEFALEQQERRESTYQRSRFLPLNAFWSRVNLSGNRVTESAEKDHKTVDVNKLSRATPTTGSAEKDHKTVDVNKLSRATPITGSAEKDHKTVDVNKLSRATPTTGSAENVHVNELSTANEEDALKDKQTINMLPIAIPLHELKDITNNFSSYCEGSIERIYRGVLRNGQVVAIKKLRSLHEQEFLLQVSMLSNLKHENVARLLGYCFGGLEQFLAFEFAQKGSLHDLLHRQQGVKGLKPGPVLSWAQRVKIAVGAAKGLEYIHQKELIHRNIRSSNVLVFDDEVAKIADCDVSAPSPDEGLAYYGYYHPSVFSRPHGYHPPEYVWHGELSWRTDVYSFGVVLLQLLTGSRVVDETRLIRQQHIVAWATPYLSEGKVKKIVDTRLKGHCPPKAVAKMAAIAAICVHKEAENRPEMSIVVRDLSSVGC